MEVSQKIKELGQELRDAISELEFYQRTNLDLLQARVDGLKEELTELALDCAYGFKLQEPLQEPEPEPEIETEPESVVSILIDDLEGEEDAESVTISDLTGE